MTDLTFCYLHMTENDLKVLDTIGTPEHLKGNLSDSEMDIPAHMVPPNPDDSDILPSHIHPSYPYGNPTNIKHPAARPRVPYDPTSRALFEDMGYAGGGVNGTLRWKDLALDILLPVDKEKEEAEKAAHARKMASGATTNQYQPASQQPEAAEEGDADDENENENDENDDDEMPEEREGETSYEDEDD
ncbi:hypothetical protein EDB86DRAFT_1036544 [Lactarius hatsudake]|uniref:Uncharacterized protein n=1 Tax=Lactarius akahatsu TaxID=416441 RepID=A0AAD4QDN7_9AGAM|nr:hypothetical protein EDB92DRAFT_2103528 [Lactarius akahatsu]KAH8996105.1 hypothetical protein EDB86DRAFT_1036544 [Lactarius hatsudake]KAH9039261.1 hypothetical protein EDB85DRAFT_283371 [Lactarius pseudohatsudake]KAH9074877.1 hypothetical protein EDB83DRAFT_1876806 [Lactarius deliciosus]